MLDYYDISGCYILRPWSYTIWQTIQSEHDRPHRGLCTGGCLGHKGVSSCLTLYLVPLLTCASGKSELEEHIAIRPTSETVMYPCECAAV
jgi:prolyl-tRNA synthetase